MRFYCENFVLNATKFYFFVQYLQNRASNISPLDNFFVFLNIVVCCQYLYIILTTHVYILLVFMKETVLPFIKKNESKFN